MADLHTRLLAEIERREDHAGQMSYYEVPWAERETAYLGALGQIVDECVIGIQQQGGGETGFARIIAAAARALGVEP